MSLDSFTSKCVLNTDAVIMSLFITSLPQLFITSLQQFHDYHTARGAIPSVIGYHNTQVGLPTRAPSTTPHFCFRVLWLANAMILHWQGLCWLNMALSGVDSFNFFNFCLLYLFQPFEHGLVQTDGL